MIGRRTSIAVVAPASGMRPDVVPRIEALARSLYPENPPEIRFDPQCFLRHGHFAGDDATRAAALVAAANDPAVDAVWFGRGGYGSCRIAEAVLTRLEPPPQTRPISAIAIAERCSLASIARRRQRRPRPGRSRHHAGRRGPCGDARLAMARRARARCTRTIGRGGPGLRGLQSHDLSHLLGTPLEPDLGGHVLMLEEVSEQMYRIDRAMFHVTSHAAIRRVAGIRLGRCSAIPPNDPDFGSDEEAVVRFWCERSGIAWLGRADIGHDVDNKIVPFGSRWGSRAAPMRSMTS